VVVMAELATAQAGEAGLCPVGAGAVDAVAVLVVDPLHGEPGVQRVPGRALVGVHHGAGSDPQADERLCRFFAGAKTAGNPLEDRSRLYANDNHER